ncbi:uncharacterized protein HMPREF1541_00782 [Cyphellophora europaea CBS 101466]|uniref:Uncharacterized protein n=1 Tax=Cyphellophora europaea (strain CBS 101466) TaxID=1220924 RepID=W2SCZ0_CYPE1|nr:uncharacterized protein HMPREF1541_00782 [Cyphellophora europaea CBS 101466]ETN46596.1 hypothetical protein HMPREF1541_00782 [Cyphellophora europaea CBS 101466]
MPYTGLPHDEETLRGFYLKEFHDYYGESANAAELYKVQPIWMRFAPAFPRIAFLLDSLYDIYTVIDDALVDFHTILVHFDLERDWLKMGLPPDTHADAFAFFNDANMEGVERMLLLQMRWALHRSRNGQLEYLFRECARNLLTVGKLEERKLIREELTAPEGEAAEALRYARPGKVGFMGARRKIMAREAMLDDALSRIKEALEVKEAPRALFGVDADEHDLHGTHHVDYQYGNGPVPESKDMGKVARFSDESPARPHSPSWDVHRGRELTHGFRSVSRDSMRSSIYPGSSVTTWAPEAPEDRFSVSVRVFSATTNGWVESIANYDTGCDAGNFVSSSFIEDHLNMGHAIEEDPEADSRQIVDIAGTTQFKPRGRIKLTWVGRNLHKGRKGKRSEEFSGYFYVAPRLPTGQTAEPFQILLGKDFIDENEVFTYRGFRLFRIKKPTTPQDTDELERRERLRQEMEDERRSERQASDAASIMTGSTGTSGISPLLAATSHSPRSSSQSVSTSASAANGLGVDAHAIA